MEDKKKEGASMDVLYAANFVRLVDLGYMEVEKNGAEKNSRKN